MVWESIVEKVAKELHSRTMKGLISEAMVKHAAQELMQGVFAGYGKDFDTPGLGVTDFEQLKFMEQNVFVFSGCKNYVQLKEMTQLLYEKDGTLRSFNDFMKDVRAIDHTYSVNYAQAEYNHAQNSSLMASKWQTIQAEKEALPWLKYMAVKDSHTRPEHAALDGITRKADDDFWAMWMPPNGWNCRCDVQQLSTGTETDLNTVQIPVTDKMWQGNVGISGVIFPAKHPYFKAAGSQQQQVAQVAKKLAPVRKPKAAAKGQSRADLVEQAKAIFDGNMPMQAKSITVSAELSPEGIAARNKQLSKLFSEYKVTTVYDSKAITSLKYSSTSSSLGRMVTANNGTYLHEANFGHKVDKARAIEVINEVRTKSRCDAKHLEVSTLTHEFAHLITMSGQTMTGARDKRVAEFWPKMRSIRVRYSTAINKGTQEELNKIHLGLYASKNIDEFFAEAFTEYKLYSKPSPFAVEVGKLVDETFKR